MGQWNGKLGIELVGARVEKTLDVRAAANAVVGKGVQALWMGGDNTVETAIDAYVEAARKGRIPVFIHTPDLARNGPLMALGADYYEVGVLGGELAADVLDGADMTKIPVKDVVPEFLALNLTALRGLKDPWKIPRDLVERAELVIDEKGRLRRRSGEKRSGEKRSGKKWKLVIVKYVDSATAEEGVRGLLDGLAQSGLKKGRDFTAAVKSAQGDIATLNSIMDWAKQERADMVLPIGTPTLQAALRRFKETPLVYAVVASGVAAGAGRSKTDHLPNVTGVDVVSPFKEMADIIPRCMPSARRVGSLFAPGETNSVYYRDLLAAALKKKGIALVTAPVNSPSEVTDAMLSLGGRGIDMICQIADNVSDSCFVSYAAAADKMRLPLFCFVSIQAARGAVLSLPRDYYVGARDSGRLAARVMRGESPAGIPFTNMKTSQVLINLRKAREFGIRIPEDMVKRADRVIR